MTEPESRGLNPFALPLRDYDVNPYIAHYKSRNPSFPHETTADQFFSEEQFECYRALGFEVVMRALKPERAGRRVVRSPTTKKVAEIRGLNAS